MHLSIGVRLWVWELGLAAFGLLINLIASAVLGDVITWHNWVCEHANGLFLWRLSLYATLIYAWWRMRNRLLQREPQVAGRLQRTEAAAIVALTLLEAANTVAGRGAT